MIHIYYGFGKGKTCSAVGAGIRAHGAGMKVLMVQFFKDNSSNELHSIPFEVVEAPSKLPFHPSADMYLPWVNSAINYVKNSSADVIILDEFIDLIPNFISLDDAKELLNNDKEYILTGHSRIDELVEIADYVTNFQKEKHPYDNGVNARRGIEY